MKKIYILLSAALLAAACQQGTTESINVIPYPNEVEIRSGSFNAAGADFHYAPEFDQAAKDAINGWDPTGGALYYYNPAVATSAWIFDRQTVTVIGKHVFAI